MGAVAAVSVCEGAGAAAGSDNGAAADAGAFAVAGTCADTVAEAGTAVAVRNPVPANLRNESLTESLMKCATPRYAVDVAKG